MIRLNNIRVKVILHVILRLIVLKAGVVRNTTKKQTSVFKQGLV